MQGFETALALAPTRSLKATLVRCVAFAPLAAKGTPDFLFTSGRPNRLNPGGVDCIYFAEDEKTARAEYNRAGSQGFRILQPVTMFFAEVSLRKVLDLGEVRTCKILRLTRNDLKARWRRAKGITKLQLLGQAVSKLGTIEAIRYPSEAARTAGFLGFNLVIFRDAIREPAFVHILGSTRKPLQKWP